MCPNLLVDSVETLFLCLATLFDRSRCLVLFPVPAACDDAHSGQFVSAAVSARGDRVDVLSVPVIVFGAASVERSACLGLLVVPVAVRFVSAGMAVRLCAALRCPL